MNLYDKIFKPKRYVLANQEVVEEKATRTPIYVALFVVIIVLALYITEFDFAKLVQNGRQFWQILFAMFPPEVSYLDKIISPLLDTIKMSFIGSIVGCILAVPFAILAANNIVHIKWLNQLVRIIFTVLRTLPTLVSALIATYIWGLGTFAGTVAIFIFSFSYMGKQLFEQIETVDMAVFEALEALGASKAKAFVVGVIPQLLPIYLSTALFNFEGNVRYAAILGYVGAGGIGVILNENISWRDYQNVGMILLTLLVAVICIETISQQIRARLT